MKANKFYLIVTFFCLLLLGIIAVCLFAPQSFGDAALIFAWLFLLLLPLAIYHELSYPRIASEDPALNKLRKHRRDYSKLAKTTRIRY